MGKKKLKRNCNRLGQIIKEQDMFGADVQFNIGGQTKITSVPGLILTIILTIILMAYSF